MESSGVDMFDNFSFLVKIGEGRLEYRGLHPIYLCKGAHGKGNVGTLPSAYFSVSAGAKRRQGAAQKDSA